MRLSTATVLSVLVLSSSAMVITSIKAADAGFDWFVTNWTAACVPDNCTYSFAISGEDYTGRPPMPAFNATCEGQGEGSAYALCTIADSSTRARRVSAKLLASNATSGQPKTAGRIQVSYMYLAETSSSWWNWTGKADVPYGAAGPAAFTIVPDTIMSVTALDDEE